VQQPAAAEQLLLEPCGSLIPVTVLSNTAVNHPCNSATL
jgi:hypothetical protein